jgi:hypothetical protein
MKGNRGSFAVEPGVVSLAGDFELHRNFAKAKRKDRPALLDGLFWVDFGLGSGLGSTLVFAELFGFGFEFGGRHAHGFGEAFGVGFSGLGDSDFLLVSERFTDDFFESHRGDERSATGFAASAPASTGTRSRLSGTGLGAGVVAKSGSAEGEGQEGWRENPFA